MTLPAPIRFLLWVLSGMTPYRAEDLLRDERLAAMHLYSTSRRDVMALPSQLPHTKKGTKR